MQEFLLGATFVDFIVALVALEAGALLIWRAVTGRGPSPLPLLSNLLSGAFLLLALRNALSGASSVPACIACRSSCRFAPALGTCGVRRRMWPQLRKHQSDYFVARSRLVCSTLGAS
jgi:hypothetical protein